MIRENRNERRKAIRGLGVSLTITINITIDIGTIGMVFQKTTTKTSNEYVENKKHQNSSKNYPPYL